MALLCTATNFVFGGKYDLIQFHRQIVHEKLIEIFTTSIFI